MDWKTPVVLGTTRCVTTVPGSHFSVFLGVPSDFLIYIAGKKITYQDLCSIKYLVHILVDTISRCRTEDWVTVLSMDNTSAWRYLWFIFMVTCCQIPGRGEGVWCQQ
ncbi:hypothetical protein XENOCAPTIV_027625 [Xenoophorus captivus]|uniref:Uncharacterized protein n=1 Tax=Xenoophorus captivus TaxID=1517983 RepID=A0ABV0RJM6_9TELE